MITSPNLLIFVGETSIEANFQSITLFGYKCLIKIIFATPYFFLPCSGNYSTCHSSLILWSQISQEHVAMVDAIY